MKKSNFLSKSEMKKILGGVEYPVGPQCQVSCDPGQFACCKGGDPLPVAACTCRTSGKETDSDCTSGGEGSSSCGVS